MGSQGAVERIALREWLAPVEDNSGRVLGRAFEAVGAAGPRIKNALHGTWLGHPLHVVLTDVPIGAWTAAVIFDFMDATGGRGSFSTAADRALLVGVAGAAGAAST